MKKYKIAVAGTGYVGLSIATLLSQHHKVVAVDIVPEKIEMINNRKSPIQDDYIEKYLAEKDLDLTATLDAKTAYSDADFVVIAAPTNYDSHTQHFDICKPFFSCFFINCYSAWLKVWIVCSDFFDTSSITFATGICNYDSIKRCFLLSHSS